MISAPFLLKIVVAKIILSLGYSGFLVYQPVIFSEPPQIAHLVVNVETQKGGDAAKSNSLPLSKDKIRPEPRRKDGEDFSTKLSAQSYVVVDAETEKNLLSEAADAPRAIGSITKLMSAIIFLENSPAWDKEVVIDKNDGGQGKLYVFEGETANVKDLFFASLVGSSNNATMALARSSGLSLEAFVQKMNQKAKALGLKNTFFKEPTGLDSNNRSTAREVALLLKYALQKDLIREAVTVKNYDITVVNTDKKLIKRLVENTDILLSNDFKDSHINSILGAKTGFIEEAGYCFVMETQNKDGKKIIAAILGADNHFNRFSEAKVLAEWVYKNYLWPGEEGFDELVQN